jgi:hypothetical protein
MAAPTHNPSRRALLGAAVALPLLGGAGRHCEQGSDAAIQTRAPTGLLRSARNDESAWRRALARFEQAEAELRAFERLTEGASMEEEAALQDGHDQRIDAFCAALRRLLRTPAPDLAALAAKIALAIDHDAGGLTGGEACLAVLRRDARRLAWA